MINVIPFRPLAGHDEFTIQFGSPLLGYYKLNVTIGRPLTFSWVHTIKTKKNISNLVKVIQNGEEPSNLAKKASKQVKKYRFYKSDEEQSASR